MQLTLIMLSVIPIVVIAAVMFGKFVKDMAKAQQDAQAAATTAAGTMPWPTAFFFVGRCSPPTIYRSRYVL
jgi:hypothetical protein